MKSAEIWADEMGFLGQGYVAIVKQIQLDAYKAGMSDAAKIILELGEDYDKEHGFTDPETGTREYPKRGEEYLCTLDDIESKILTARDNKTTI